MPDAETTIKRWKKYSGLIAYLGFKLAMVVQDGMSPADVPPDAECVFVGGSTEWKIANAHRFKGVAPLLHIGRVNTIGRVKWARKIGADSVDGTGWFRGADRQRDFISCFENRLLG